MVLHQIIYCMSLNHQIHLLLFITRKYTIINVNVKLINAKTRSFYLIYIH